MSKRGPIKELKAKDIAINSGGMVRAITEDGLYTIRIRPQRLFLRTVNSYDVPSLLIYYSLLILLFILIE